MRFRMKPITIWFPPVGCLALRGIAGRATRATLSSR